MIFEVQFEVQMCAKADTRDFKIVLRAMYLLRQEVKLLTSLSSEVLPSGQGIQAVAPSFGWYVPAGHFSQMPVVTFLNSPDGQGAATKNILKVEYQILCIAALDLRHERLIEFNLNIDGIQFQHLTQIRGSKNK